MQEYNISKIKHIELLEVKLDILEYKCSLVVIRKTQLALLARVLLPKLVIAKIGILYFFNIGIVSNNLFVSPLYEIIIAQEFFLQLNASNTCSPSTVQIDTYFFIRFILSAKSCEISMLSLFANNFISLAELRISTAFFKSSLESNDNVSLIVISFSLPNLFEIDI